MPNYAQQTTEKPKKERLEKKARKKYDKAAKKISKGFAAKSDAKMERKFAKATKKSAKARALSKKAKSAYGMKMKDKFGMGGKISHDSNYELLDKQSN